MKTKHIAVIVCAALLLFAAAAFYYFFQLDTSFVKATVAERLEKAVGRKVEIGGELDISLRFPLRVSVNDLKVQNAPWATSPYMLAVERLDAGLRLIPLLLGNVHIDGLVLSEAKIYLETSKSGEWNVVFLAGNLPAAEGSNLRGPPVGDIRVDRGTLLYRSGPSGERQRVEIEDLVVEIGQMDAPMDIKTEGMYKKLPFSAAGSVKPAAALFDTKKKMAVSAEIGIGENNIALDGSIDRSESTPVARIDFDINADSPSDLNRIAALPGDWIKPVRATGRFKNTGGATFRFTNLEARMDRNHIAGNLTLETGGGPVAFEADLSSEYLDLRDFIRRRPQGGGNKARGTPAERSPRLFSEQPLELGFLDRSQGSVRLDAEKLVLPFLALADAKITLELKNRRLRLDPLEARIDGGGALAGEMNLAADRQPPGVRANLRIKHLDLETMLDKLGAKKAVKGDLGLDLDVGGRGGSVRDIMGGLDGEIVIAMQNGQIAAEYLKKAERLNLDLTDNFLKLFDFTEKKKDFAEINCFVGKFVVKEGLADCRVLVFDTDRIGVLGEGKIDLKTEQLNMSLKPIKKGGISLGAIGNIGADVGALPDNFNVGGTLSRPVISVDKSKTAVSTLMTLGKAIGGTVLLGPAGLAAALVDLDIGEKNPCVRAMKEAASEEAAAESEKD